MVMQRLRSTLKTSKPNKMSVWLALVFRDKRPKIMTRTPLIGPFYEIKYDPIACWLFINEAGRANPFCRVLCNLLTLLQSN